MRCYPWGWRDIDGGAVLPGFTLEVWKIDQVIEDSESENSNGSEMSVSSSNKSDIDINCPECDNTFDDSYDFMKHFEDEHVRLLRRVRNQ